MYKFSMIFRQATFQNKTAGWSETWYIDSSEGEVEAAIRRLSQARVNLLASRGLLRWCRLQVVGQRARLISINLPGGLHATVDIPQMALQCSVRGAGVTNTKHFQLRGLPDGLVDSGDFEADDPWTRNFNAYGRSLAAEVVRFRAKTLTNPTVGIVSIGADGTFKTQAPLVYNEGDFLELVRVRNTSGQAVKGKYFVDVKTDDRNGKFLGYSGGVVTLSGGARLSAISYPAVLNGSLSWKEVTTRKVGRPFDLYRGRVTKR